MNTTEIMPAQAWAAAVTGRYGRPNKKTVTIRVDADVLTWFREQGKGYQTRINAILRKVMESSNTQDV